MPILVSTALPKPGLGCPRFLKCLFCVALLSTVQLEVTQVLFFGDQFRAYADNLTRSGRYVPWLIGWEQIFRRTYQTYRPKSSALDGASNRTR